MQKKEIEKFFDSEILEGMSSISALIKAIEQKSNINNRKILKILIDENKKRSKAREITFLKVKSQQLGFVIEFVNTDIISNKTVGQTHGGIIAECTSRDIPKLTKDSLNKNGIYYFLEGVEDPYNFGYAVRSLYAAGADGLILSPRNWMGASGIVARSSAGASELIDMYISDPTEAIKIFKELGYNVICGGIRNSVSIFDSNLKKPLFVILGGEKRGISGAVLDMADTIVRIDYGTEFGGSLSTAAAAAVFGFEILRQNRKS
jgi:23S rRNA (guanosine2251-2'-O)-methyltransferase